MRRKRARASLLGFLVLAQALTAWASTFTVNPVRLVLSGRTRSALLTLQNSSTETLRFQLEVAAWDQSPQGEMQLGPTKDIVFFPQLLSLQPGEQRKVRVGATVPPGPREKTYRIFVEELPPLQKPSTPGEGAELRVLTKMGIPIFLEPSTSRVEGRIERVTVRGGRLSFEIRNRGTVHFTVQAVRVTGFGAGGEPVLNGRLEGWYVLAGGTRVYDLELPADDCGKVEVLALDAETSRETLSERVEVPAGACAR